MIYLVMSKGEEKSTMFVMKGLREDGGEYIVLSNLPGTTASECSKAGFVVSGRNLPSAARWFVEKAGIGNPKGIQI